MTTPNENSIRDQLMQQLHMVEHGLVPVAREHYLRNTQGASGFLDILARDADGRLVIIEIKRTDGAAREALQELSKYAALLRSNYLVQNVDYRLMVLAVEWHELLIPYSEFVKHAPYEVSAGKIILDDAGLPLRVELITPVVTASQRKISNRQFLWRFQNEANANAAATKIAEHMRSVGLRDFVLLRTRPTDPRISTNSFLYFAQQELSLSEYQSLIRANTSDEEYEEYLEGISGLVEEEDRIAESADHVWLPGYDELYVALQCETSEISHPEKAAGWFAPGAQSEVHIFRYGRFNGEELSDETIVSELVGSDGASDVRLRLTARTDSAPQMAALYAAVENVFFFNPSWRGEVRDLLAYAQRTGPASVACIAFCNDDILRAIAGLAFDFPGFAPTFRLDIERNDGRTERFIGLPEWKGSAIEFDPIIAKHFDGDPFSYFLAYHFGEHRALNEDIMSELGLVYAVFREGLTGPERIRVQGSSVVVSRQPILGSISTLISANRGEVEKIVSLFMSHDQGFVQLITEWVNREENIE